MIAPSFVIFAQPRSGSTTIQRGLNLLPGVSVAFEPMFDDIEPVPSAVSNRVLSVLTDHVGFKHVFRETGYPFRPVHDAPRADMERDRALWFELNKAVLQVPGLRVVFLRRRDEFHRILSDLIARVTDMWGFSEREVTDGETQEYRTAVAGYQLPALDADLIRWHIRHMTSLSEELRASVATTEVLDLWYEDLFGADVTLADRVERFSGILTFLGLGPVPSVLESRELALLLRPSAKMNDETIFARIPNYKDLCDQFGVCPTGSAESPQRVSPGEVVATHGLAPRHWRFRCVGRSIASVRVTDGALERARVEIAVLVPTPSYGIQLNWVDGSCRAGNQYRLTFRARSDQRRSIAVGVAAAEAPWHNLGLYLAVQLDDAWQETSASFVATGSADVQRVHFDLGEHAATVEIEGVHLDVVTI